MGRLERNTSHTVVIVAVMGRLARTPSFLRRGVCGHGQGLSQDGRSLYRLYLGVANGMSIARVRACRYLRNEHAVGDAEIEPI